LTLPSGVPNGASARLGRIEAALPPRAQPRIPRPAKCICLQRKAEKPGRRLGKTTGWIHRANLAMKSVRMLGGVTYEKITVDGIILSHGTNRESPGLLPVDGVVICAGQEPDRRLSDALKQLGIAHHIIGGADVAVELDAKRAIDQGARLAAQL
jgi:2,4-dienoyl-CoA reductase (NADPH2)